MPGLRGAAAQGGGGTPMIALDTETTGLGNDAGTVAFLVGAAWFERAEHGREVLVVEQWSLLRLSAEAAMLRSFAGQLVELAGPSTVLLTFNGASFDLPLLRARCHRGGVDAAVLEGAHVDLLLPARRLWRDEHDDCRLSTLERSRLGVARADDVDGSQIPQAYWSWLETPEDPSASALLERVHVHNQVDLLTLPALAAEIAEVVRSPSGLAEAVRVARLEIARSDEPAALRVLRPWLPPLEALSVRAELEHLLGSVSPSSVEGSRSQARTKTAEPPASTRLADPRGSRGSGRAAPCSEPPALRHALGGVGERMARLGVVAGARRGPTVTRLRAGESAHVRADREHEQSVGGGFAVSVRPRDAPIPASGSSDAISSDLRGLSHDERRAWVLGAKLVRRSGDDARSAALWAQMCRRAPGDPEAHEALAKLLEHRLGGLMGDLRGNLQAALAVASASSAPCPRRLERLRRKVAKHSRREPDSVYG